MGSNTNPAIYQPDDLDLDIIMPLCLSFHIFASYDILEDYIKKKILDSILAHGKLSNHIN